MPQNLVGFLGGIAASGARYKIEIRFVGDGYEAHSFNAGGSGAWTKPTLVKSGPWSVVIKAASSKFAEKTRPGRDRIYTQPMNGGPNAGPFPKAVSDLPSHPLCWQIGEGNERLPYELHAEASPSWNAAWASDAAVEAVPAPPPLPATPDLGHLVMLCETIPTLAAFQAYLTDDRWLLTEKMEGDRGQLHHDREGRVYLTNRSGEVVNCPPHIETAMRAGTMPGTSLDGEVISVDEAGRAQLYVGGKATIQLFVAFDLLHYPSCHDAMGMPQIERLNILDGLLIPFQVPVDRYASGLRLVRWAQGTQAKQRLYREVRDREGEGWVARATYAYYAGKRSDNWMRYRDRLATLDVVVCDYKRGTGKFRDTVGAVQVGLYEGQTLYSIGWVGSGWDDAQRAAFWDAWQAGTAGQVVTVQSFGLSFRDQVIRPSGVAIRTPGDKRPVECQFQSEAKRARVNAPKVQ
ncbi:hypothetical protein EKD04_017540 [Chloroflexales bacterium ZM16-3]|nr:hypothetical protein [Chloroflexales bacterium ZM16-3]